MIYYLFFQSVEWLPHDHLYGSLWPRMCFGCSSGWPFCLSQWTLLHLFAFTSLTSPIPDSDVPQGSNSGPLLFSSCRGLTQCPTLNTISLKWLPPWHLQLCPHPWMPTVSLTPAFEWNRQLKLNESQNELLVFPHKSASATTSPISINGHSNFTVTRAPSPLKAVP